VNGLAWFFTTSGGYLAVAMLAYRIQYVRTFKAYRRWQIADPSKTVEVQHHGEYSSGTTEKVRKDVGYWKYLFNISTEDREGPEPLAPPWHFLWPIVGTLFFADKILHPKLKIADPSKTIDLEKELKTSED
jgi:hypothetical protein